MKPIAVKTDGDWMSLDADLRDYPGKIYAFLPAAIARISLAATAKAAGGANIDFQRRFICILLGVLSMGTWRAGADGVAASGPATQPAPIPLLKTDTPLVIDGDLNKPQWKKVEPIRVDYIQSKKGTLSDTPRETVRYLWDDHYLYIGYEFFSKNLKAQGTGKKKGPPGNEREGAEIWLTDKNVDVAEFSVSFDDPNFSGRFISMS
ncbi:MAG TPA: sugar-binding protein [Tepidisphaeraceae bacterium]|jgi:hypothetical protein|nr:sugar-binding protein [Tepidisphaeraceae bacterium]